MYKNQDAMVLLNALHKNYKGFTMPEINEANAAAEACQLVGNPLICKFSKIVSSNIVSDYPVWPDVATHSSVVYDRDSFSVNWTAVKK